MGLPKRASVFAIFVAISCFHMTSSYQLLSNFPAVDLSSICSHEVRHANLPPLQDPPVTLQLSTSSYQAGSNNVVRVTLSSAVPGSIIAVKGFVLQAQTVSGAAMDGTWLPLTGQLIYNGCGNSVSTVIHDGNANPFTLPLMFDFSVPSTNSGNLEFRLTLVQNFATFWENIIFDQVLVSQDNANSFCDTVGCFNGGTCVFIGFGFCQCVQGFSGIQCENNPCDQISCLNGGTCVVANGVAMCMCPGTFFGEDCGMIGNNPCDNLLCINGGSCTSVGQTAFCNCLPGFTGTLCEVQATNPCDSSPCLAGGTCTSSGTSFTCNCPTYFSGPTCGTFTNPCINPNPCQSGGTCDIDTTSATGFTCQCPAGFQGNLCQTQIAITLEMEREILSMDIINKISGENTTTEEVVIASETIAEISDDEVYLEDDPQRVEFVISSLEAVVSAGEASINITDPVVRTINSLMNLEQGFLDDGMIQGGRAVAALEGQITNFQTLDGNFSTVLDNVGVTAVKIDARSLGSSLAYANIFPENETPLNVGALQEGSTRLFSDGDAMPLERTTTSISVPTTVLELLGEAGVKLTEVPVTFIIYGNDVLFRPSMPTEVEETIEEEDYSTVTERVASQIISAIIRTEDTNIVNLPPGSPVITTFLTNLTITVNEVIEAHDCVVWSYNEDTGEGFWTKDGCERMSHDNLDRTMCSCDRLGSFAILIRVRKGPVEVQVALYYITLIGSIISGLALIGCLIIFVSLKSFRSKQPTHIHINLCLSLLGFYISFLLNPLAVGKEILCAVASVFVHFFCLATLAWMSAEAMNMYYVFLKAERRAVRHFLPIAYVLAYGLPAACALLVLFLDNSTDFQSVSYCFTHPGYALYFGFVTEVCAMFVFNFIIFIWVIRKILCRPLMVSKTAENAKRNEIIKRVRHAVLFWFVLGLSWIFGFLAAVDTKTLIFDYLYCFFISIQGILMFLLLCVANPAFRGMFRKTDSTQTKVTRQAKTRSLSSSQLGSSSQSNIPMDSMDNPSTSATE